MLAIPDALKSLRFEEKRVNPRVIAQRVAINLLICNVVSV